MLFGRFCARLIVINSKNCEQNDVADFLTKVTTVGGTNINTESREQVTHSQKFF